MSQKSKSSSPSFLTSDFKLELEQIFGQHINNPKFQNQIRYFGVVYMLCADQLIIADDFYKSGRYVDSTMVCQSCSVLILKVLKNIQLNIEDFQQHAYQFKRKNEGKYKKLMSLFKNSVFKVKTNFYSQYQQCFSLSGYIFKMWEVISIEENYDLVFSNIVYSTNLMTKYLFFLNQKLIYKLNTFQQLQNQLYLQFALKIEVAVVAYCIRNLTGLLHQLIAQAKYPKGSIWDILRRNNQAVKKFCLYCSYQIAKLTLQQFQHSYKESKNQMKQMEEQETTNVEKEILKKYRTLLNKPHQKNLLAKAYVDLQKLYSIKKQMADEVADQKFKLFAKRRQISRIHLALNSIGIFLQQKNDQNLINTIRNFRQLSQDFNYNYDYHDIETANLNGCISSSKNYFDQSYHKIFQILQQYYKIGKRKGYDPSRNLVKQSEVAEYIKRRILPRFQQNKLKQIAENNIILEEGKPEIIKFLTQMKQRKLLPEQAANKILQRLLKILVTENINSNKVLNENVFYNVLKLINEQKLYHISESVENIKQLVKLASKYNFNVSDRLLSQGKSIFRYNVLNAFYLHLTKIIEQNPDQQIENLRRKIGRKISNQLVLARQKKVELDQQNFIKNKFKILDQFQQVANIYKYQQQYQTYLNNISKLNQDLSKVKQELDQQRIKSIKYNQQIKQLTLRSAQGSDDPPIFIDKRKYDKMNEAVFKAIKEIIPQDNQNVIKFILQQIFRKNSKIQETLDQFVQMLSNNKVNQKYKQIKKQFLSKSYNFNKKSEIKNTIFEKSQIDDELANNIVQFIRLIFSQQKNKKLVNYWLSRQHILQKQLQVLEIQQQYLRNAGRAADADNMLKIRQVKNNQLKVYKEHSKQIFNQIGEFLQKLFKHFKYKFVDTAGEKNAFNKKLLDLIKQLGEKSIKMQTESQGDREVGEIESILDNFNVDIRKKIEKINSINPNKIMLDLSQQYQQLSRYTQTQLKTKIFSLQTEKLDMQANLNKTVNENNLIFQNFKCIINSFHNKMLQSFKISKFLNQVSAIIQDKLKGQTLITGSLSESLVQIINFIEQSMNMHQKNYTKFAQYHQCQVKNLSKSQIEEVYLFIKQKFTQSYTDGLEQFQQLKRVLQQGLAIYGKEFQNVKNLIKNL